MKSDEINLEEMRVEAEKMLPGIGEFIQEGGEVIRISPGETLDLFGARSVEEIDRILDSENRYLRALIDKPRVDFPFRRYESTLKAFCPVEGYHNPELIEEISSIRDQYEEEEKHPMSLSIFLSRGKSGKNYLDKAIEKVKDRNRISLNPSYYSWIPLDPATRVEGILSIPPELYGEEKFYSTSTDNKSVGIAAMISEPREIINETTGKEIEKTRRKILKGLDGLDRRIITACDMELEAGNQQTTLNQLYKNAGNLGNINDRTASQWKNRIIRLSATPARLDNKSEELSGWDYKRAPVNSTLVPCIIIENPEKLITLRGQAPNEIIEFLVKHLPFREFSRIRGQGDTISAEWYQTGNRKTPENCSMEDYLIERIIWRDDKYKVIVYGIDIETGEKVPVKIKLIVSWNKLYSVSGISDAGRKKKLDFRVAVNRALSAWLEKKYILGFEADAKKSSISIYLPLDDKSVQAIEAKNKRAISDMKSKKKK